MSAFGFQEKNGKKKTVVKNKNACVVMCRGCEDICPAKAITHPSEEKTQKIIEKLKTLTPKINNPAPVMRWQPIYR
jgi:formate hydrogenlyase subunit 6/NADH:ubiquinone oxidoreductase subunit I